MQIFVLELFADMPDTKTKLLEYLEKEYDSLGSQIESVTNRAGIAVTLLSSVAFLALENETLAGKTITLFKCILSAKIVLGVFFILSIMPLLCVLIVRKRFERLHFVALYNDLYADPCRISTESQKFYTELLILICEHNKKQLQTLSRYYNLSMILIFIFVVIYILL